MAEQQKGILAGLAAYGMWGLFPLYFHQLQPTGPVEILLWRVVLTLLVVLLALKLRTGWQWFSRLRSALLRRVVLAAVLLAANWLVYIWAVENNRVVEAALGYFINPLFSVVLGVVVLHEKLRQIQKAAVGLGIVAVCVMTIAYGRPPIISLFLAVTFGYYGYLKKRIDLTALQSLAAETSVMLPFAVIGFGWMYTRGHPTLGHHGPLHSVLLLLVGIATALPLTLFTTAAQRIPLSMLGLLQFITPVMQMMCAVLVFHEKVSASRWAGFFIVWCALALLISDLVRQLRTPAEAVLEPV